MSATHKPGVLLPHHLDDLRRSGLSDNIIQEMRIEEVKGPKSLERLNEVLGFSHIDKQSILQMTECYLIPYPCPDFTRVKLHYKIEGAKYLSPKKSHIDTAFHLYFLPEEQEKLSKQKYALIITEGEKKTAKGFRKSFIAWKDIKKGDILTEDNTIVKRPGLGIWPQYYKAVIGAKVNKDIKKDDFIRWEDITERV